jgi:hypothetical protein
MEHCRGQNDDDGALPWLPDRRQVVAGEGSGTNAPAKVSREGADGPRAAHRTRRTAHWALRAFQAYRMITLRK